MYMLYEIVNFEVKAHVETHELHQQKHPAIAIGQCSAELQILACW